MEAVSESNKDTDDVCIVLIKSNERIYILSSDDAAVAGFKSIEDGLSFFENGYYDCHSRSYESSMSACMNWMLFSPSVIKVRGLNEISDMVTDPIKQVYIRNVSGSMKVLVTNEKVSNEYWDKGKKPKVI